MIEIKKEWLKRTIEELYGMEEEELKLLSILVKDELQRKDFFRKAEIERKKNGIT